jgi:hypothetical protein
MELIWLIRSYYFQEKERAFPALEDWIFQNLDTDRIARELPRNKIQYPPYGQEKFKPL